MDEKQIEKMVYSIIGIIILICFIGGWMVDFQSSSCTSIDGNGGYSSSGVSYESC